MDSISDIEEYNSHNTTRLNNEKLKKLLLSIDLVSSALKGKNY